MKIITKYLFFLILLSNVFLIKTAKAEGIVQSNQNNQSQNNAELDCQKNINALQILLMEREDKISEKMLGYSSQSLQHSKDTINYFLLVLSVITFISFLLGWKTVKGIKKDAKEKTLEIAREEVKKVTASIESKISVVEKKVNKKNKLDNLYRKLNLEQNLNNRLEISNKIIEIAPKDYMAYGTKGIILLDMQRFDDAVEFLDKAIDINPRDITAYLNKAASLTKLSKFDDAIKCFDKAIEINPKNASIYGSKATCLLDLKRYKEALDYSKKALDIDPTNYEYVADKAFIYMGMEEYSEAIVCLNEARTMDFTCNDGNCGNKNYEINLSFSYHKLKNFYKAYKVSSAGLLMGFSLELVVNKGLAAAALGKSDEAICLIESAEEIGAKKDEVLYCKSRIYSLLKNYDDAIKYLKEAINMNENFKEDAKKEEDFVFIKNSADFKTLTL